MSSHEPLAARAPSPVAAASAAPNSHARSVPLPAR